MYMLHVLAARPCRMSILHALAEYLMEVRKVLAKVGESFSGMLAKVSGSICKSWQKLAD
jgi:hypothetical protein